MPEDAVIPTQSNYIVKGWLSEDTTSIVFGASNVGKSFSVWIWPIILELIKTGWAVR